MLRIFREAFFLLLLLFITLPSLGQVYPVQLDMYIRPPYSTRMTDYTSPGADKLQLRMFLSDATKDMAQVRLQIQVEGPGVILRTRQGYVPQPFTVEKGIPLMLSGADLAEYFDARNLDITGMPRAQYAAGSSLPEGHYRFSITAIDYYSGLPLSIAGQTNGWLILNDPPMLNFPARAKKVKPEEPQYLTFQWTPRHMGSPNSAFGTEYLFELFEIWPEGARAEDAVRTQTPIYSTVTMQTQLAYTVGETALFRGRRYAWRVTAQPIAGTADFDLFKNGGRSEVYSFRYGDPCLPVEHHEVVKVTDSSVELTWETDNNHTHTVVQYRSTEENRLADDEESWYTIKTEQNSTTIARLQPEMEIEYRLQTYCGSHYTETPESHFVTTDASYKPDFVCGGDPADIKIENQEPLDILMAGDVVMAGDFPVMIDKVKGRGTFTGEGTVGIPFLKQGQLRFTFENIKVNTDYQLIDGHFEAGTDLKSIVGEGKFEVTLEEGEEKNLIKVDAEVADVVISSNGISLMTRDSVPGELARDITDGLKIRGSDGNTTVITPKGGGEGGGSPTVMTTDVAAATGTGNSNASGGGTDSGSGTKVDAKTKTDYKYVEFSKAEQEYGFDNWRYEQLDRFYRKMNILGKQRQISWKSFKEGMTDPVKVDVKGAKGIGFTTILGDDYKLDKKGQLTLKSPAADQVNELYAYTTVGKGKEAKRLILGQLNLVGYAGLSRKVVIIPLMNGNETAKCSSQAEIKTKLNEIYKQAGVEWDVQVVDPFDISEINGEKGLVLEAGGNLIGSAYNGTLKAIINSYRDAEKTAYDQNNDETYYIFLADRATGMDKEPDGYMRLQNPFGFVFTGKTKNFHRTLAHELGHGAFGLRHPFMEHKLEENEKHNLMSYGEGKELFKYQWDLIHDPASWVFDVLQTEEEAENYVKEGPFADLDFGMNKDSSFTFITPAYQTILLPSNVSNVSKFFGYHGMVREEELLKFLDICPGTLESFMIDGTTYKAKVEGQVGEYSLVGYFSENNKEYKPEEFELVSSDGNKNQGIIYAFEPKAYYIFQVNTSALSVYKPSSPIVPLDKFSLSFKYESPKKTYVKTGNKQYSINDAVLQKAFAKYELTSDLILLRNKMAELWAYSSDLMDYSTASYAEWKEAFDVGYFNAESGFKLFEHYIRDNYFAIEEVTDANENEVFKKTVYRQVKEFPDSDGEWFNLFYNYLKKQIPERLSKQGELFADLNLQDGEVSLRKKIADTPFSELLESIILSSRSELESLSDSGIYFILSRIANQSFITDDKLPFRDEEGTVVKLLESVHPKIADKVIGYLEGPNAYEPKEILYKQLFLGVDDIWFGLLGNKDNRQRLVRALVRLSLNSGKDYEKRFDEMEGQKEKRIYELEYRNVVFKLAEQSVSRLTDFYSLFDERLYGEIAHNDISTELLDNGKIKTKQTRKFGFFPKGTVLEDQLSPFDLIQLTNKTSLNHLRFVTPNPKLRKTSVPLPAIILAYADKTTSQKTIEDGIYTAIDIGSLAIGAGPLARVAQVTRLERTLLYMDFVSDVASLSSTAAHGVVDEKLQHALAGCSALTGITSLAITQASKLPKWAKKLKPDELFTKKTFDDLNTEIDKLKDDDLHLIISSDEHYLSLRHYYEKLLLSADDYPELAAKINAKLDRISQLRKGIVGLGKDNDLIKAVRWLQQREATDEVLNVLIHSDGKTLKYFDGSKWHDLTHRDLVNTLRRNKYYQKGSKRPVRLLFCGEGAAKDEIAQNLSNSLNSKVQYSPENVWVHSDSRITTGSERARDTGNWNECMPNAPPKTSVKADLNKGIVEVVDDAVSLSHNNSSIRTALARKLSSSELDRLLADFSGQTAILNRFVNEPELVDSWRILNGAGVDDKTRRNIENLDFIKKYRDKYPQKKHAEIIKQIRHAASYRLWETAWATFREKLNINPLKYRKYRNYDRKAVQIGSPNPKTPKATQRLPLEIKNNIILDKDGKPFTSIRPRTGRLIEWSYIITTDGNLRIGRGHDFLSENGEAVLAAGGIKVEGGKVTYIDNDTGHFWTTEAELAQAGQIIRDAGIAGDNIIIHPFHKNKKNKKFQKHGDFY